MAQEMRKKVIFVTVGTTRFDLLIDNVTKPAALEWMASNGYTNLVIQYGRGNKPTLPQNSPIICQMYDFKDNLDQDMKEAALILSHAGAGTVMEGLKKKKRLVVVINTNLMNNHQEELANAMSSRGFLFVVSEPKDLLNEEVWNDFDSFIPIPHEGGDPYDFARLLDNHMGIREEKLKIK